MKIDVSFKINNNKLDVDFNKKRNKIDVSFLNVYRINIFDEDNTYNGEYTIIPSQEEQILNTINKVMKKNVIIKEIQMGLATSLQIDKMF